MLGEEKSTFNTVKDLAPAEFIEALAQYLKKNNLIERPSWVDVVKCGVRKCFFIQSRNSPPSMRTGSTTRSHP